MAVRGLDDQLFTEYAAMEPADRRPDDKDQGELITDIFGLQWSRPIDGRMTRIKAS
jgi:hypothetical protein